MLFLASLPSIDVDTDAARLGVALGIGMLLGVERERRKELRGGGKAIAGIRTFALVALAGGIAMVLGSEPLLAVVGGFVQPYISWRLGLAQFAPCFIAGVACYFMGYGARRRPLPFWGWPLILLAAAGIQGFGSYYEYEQVSRWVLCLMIGLTAPFFAELNRPMLNKATELIARYSYGIYLTHLHAQWAALVLLKDQPAAVRYSVLVVLSVGLPVALYHMVEAPMIRLGARLAANLPTKSVPVVRPASPQRALPAPAEAAPYGRPSQPVRPRPGQAPAVRTGKSAPAPASAR